MHSVQSAMCQINVRHWCSTHLSRFWGLSALKIRNICIGCLDFPTTHQYVCFQTLSSSPHTHTYEQLKYHVVSAPMPTYPPGFTLWYVKFPFVTDAALCGLPDTLDMLFDICMSNAMDGECNCRGQTCLLLSVCNFSSWWHMWVIVFSQK